MEAKKRRVIEAGEEPMDEEPGPTIAPVPSGGPVTNLQEEFSEDLLRM